MGHTVFVWLCQRDWRWLVISFIFSEDLVLGSAGHCMCFWDTFFHSVRRRGVSVLSRCSLNYGFPGSGLQPSHHILCLEEILLWPVRVESLHYFLRCAGRFPAVWRCPSPCCDSQDLLERAAWAPPHFWPLQPCCQLPEWVVTRVCSSLNVAVTKGKDIFHTTLGCGRDGPAWNTLWESKLGFWWDVCWGIHPHFHGEMRISYRLTCFLGVEEVNRVDVVRKALQNLPEENYHVLRFLTAFLVQVSCSKAWSLSFSSVASALHQLLDRLLPLFLWEEMNLKLRNCLSLPYVPLNGVSWLGGAGRH